MKKIYSLLIILIGIFMFNISNVDATCYKVCYQGSCIYNSVHAYDISDLNGLDECIKNKGESCYDDVTFQNADESNCSNKDGGTNSKVNLNNKVSCGNLGSFNKKLPEITSWVITLLQVAVPVILIIMGVIDFVKSISSQKDDEIKKNQQVFVKRVITAIIIFFVVVVVKLLVSLVSSGQTEKESIVKCIDCFISNKCS